MARWLVRVVFGWLIVCGFAHGAPAEIAWKDVEGARIPVPPAEHPRLYLRAEHVDQLADRLADPVLTPIRQRLEKLASRRQDCRLEWQSLGYLVDPDHDRGREIGAGVKQTCIEKVGAYTSRLKRKLAEFEDTSLQTVFEKLRLEGLHIMYHNV